MFSNMIIEQLEAMRDEIDELRAVKHTGTIALARFDQAGGCIVSGSEDSTTRVWMQLHEPSKCTRDTFG